MKKLATPCIALALALMCSISAAAMEVPTENTVQNLNGVQQYIKVYTLSPESDPQELIEEPFTYEGYRYTFSAITKRDNHFVDEQEARQIVTVETDKSDLSAVLEVLEPSMEYDDGQYSGTLNLDHTTIQTEAAGYTTKSYTVKEVKEIADLDSNDMAYVPTSTVKDGKTIQLQSVDWQVQGTALVDDILVPSRYKAVATYSGKAYYSAATGYVTTAEYVGEVSCDEIRDITYTLTYVGEPVPAAQENSAADAQEQDGSAWSVWVLPVGIAGVVVIAGAAVLVIRSRRKEDDDEQVPCGEELGEY